VQPEPTMPEPPPPPIVGARYEIPAVDEDETGRGA
jgi:hypothetical protein